MKKKEFLDNLSELLETGDFNFTQICEKLNVPRRTARNWIRGKESTDENNYTVENGTAHWKYIDKDYSISISDLDNIFYQYSKHGLNKSATQVQNEIGFSAIQWQSFKRAFNLVKDADVFSPHTLSLVEGKEKTNLIAKKISEKYSDENIRHAIAYEYEKQTAKAHQKAITELGRLDYKRRYFETALLEAVGDSKITEVTFNKRAKEQKVGVYTLADLHIGAQVEATTILPEYNNSVVIKRLGQVADIINSHDRKENIICINGDFLESFTGLNHINSWKSIDNKSGYGTRAAIDACEILKNFISSVSNVKEVILVSGNHDRVTSNNKEDVEGEITRWIQYVLELRFGDFFPISYCENVASRSIEGVSYLWTHGHLSLSKRPPSDIINQYGNPKEYNLLIEGHFHTRKIKADTSRYRSIVTSSIFTGNSYSEKLGYSTLPGFICCESNGTHPILTDIPLV